MDRAHNYGGEVESLGGKVLGIALLAGGIGLVAKSFVRPRPGEELKHLSNRDRIVAFAIGFFGGFIVGLTSVGSGVFFALTMLLAFPAPLGQGGGYRHLPRRGAAGGRG